MQIKIFSNGLLPFKFNFRTLSSPLLRAARCNNYVKLSNILKARVNEMVSFPPIYERDSSRLQDSKNTFAGTSAISNIDFQKKTLLISERSITINNAALAIISSKKLKNQPSTLMVPAPVIYTNTKICVPQGKVHCNLLIEKASRRCRRPIQISIFFSEMVKICFWARFGSILDPETNSA